MYHYFKLCCPNRSASAEEVHLVPPPQQQQAPVAPQNTYSATTHLNSPIQVRQESDYTLVMIFHDGKQLSGKFRSITMDHDENFYFQHHSPHELLNKWWITQFTVEAAKSMSFMCPAHNEILEFDGDSAFPINKINYNTVKHPYFLENDLKVFMEKHGLPLSEAKKMPEWTKKKSETVANNLDVMETLMHNGISLKDIVSMNETTLDASLTKTYHSEGTKHRF